MAFAAVSASVVNVLTKMGVGCQELLVVGLNSTQAGVLTPPASASTFLCLCLTHRFHLLF